MELKIDKRTENELLKRTEVEFSVASQGATPSRKEIRSSLQQSLKVDEELIVIDRVDNRYGTTNAKGRAIVYNDKAGLKMAQSHKMRRDRGEKGREKKEGAKKKGAKPPVKK